MATVLIVEDDDDSRTSLGEVLEQALPGIHVRVASSAREAMQVLAGEPVRLVISDYKMPGEDGLTLLARARTEAPRAARVLVTALPVASLPPAELHAAGLAHVVTKPFDARALVRMVRDCLGAAAPPRP